MGKRFIIIAVVVLALLGAALRYKSYRTESGTSGEVYSNDPPSGKIKSGTTPSDSDERSASTEPKVYPPAQSTAIPATPTTSAADSPSQAAQAGAGSGTPAANIPPADTVSPNPPNGLLFAGKGRFQLYRQGNLTWRLDTETGHTCIIFATLEEWKKPQVIRAGCNSK